MIPKYDGFNAKATATSRAILPAGNYVAKILKGEVQNTRNGGSQIIVSFDIAEGEYKDFFATDYKSASDENKKWRGTYRLFLPNGSDKDVYTVRNCNNFAGCLEESNEGYHWDWDEKKFKGLKIGVMFRDKEWEFNGKTGWTTECGSVCSVESVATAKVMKAKPLATTSRPDVIPFEELASFSGADDGELPF